VLTLEATDELGLATDGFEIDADPGELSAMRPRPRCAQILEERGAGD